MILFALLQLAFPCGGLLFGEDVQVTSKTQQVILSLKGDNTVVEYQIQYNGDAEDFGWIIPIFGEMVEIQEGDVSRFEQYDEYTRPNTIYEYASSSGCVWHDKSSGEPELESPFSEPFVQGFTGQFEYLIIPASQGEDFISWGQDNGWSTEEVSSILPQYGSESNISLVLVKIRQDLLEEEISTSPTIKIEYERHEMRYPAMLSKISSASELHTVIYVEGDGQAQVGGWGEQIVGDIEGSINDDAQSLYLQRLREISETRTSFGIVFSGEIDGVWVTRFDSLLRPEQNTHEPFFRIGQKREPFGTYVFLIQTSGAWMFGIFWGVSVFIRGRRKR